MKKIKLTRGLFTILDDEDFESLSQFCWYAHSGGRVYAARRTSVVEGRAIVKMHRSILCAEEGDLVDHKNGDTLDNRRSNLRLCNQTENARNAAGKHERKLKGISFIADRPGKPWRAQIRVDGNRLNLGSYLTAEEAARAYDHAAIQHHGVFARVNYSGDLRVTEGSQTRKINRNSPRAKIGLNSGKD